MCFCHVSDQREPETVPRNSPLESIPRSSEWLEHRFSLRSDDARSVVVDAKHARAARSGDLDPDRVTELQAVRDGVAHHAAQEHRVAADECITLCQLNP